MPSYGPAVKALLQQIRAAGYASGVVRTMIPDWWSAEVELEPGALTELKILLARRLGLNLVPLLESGQVGLTFPAHVKYKRALGVADKPVSEPFIAYASAVAKSIAAALQVDPTRPEFNPSFERAAILADPKIKWLSLNALLRRCWTELGIAVVQLEAAPTATKLADAMTVRIGNRYIILIAKKYPYPAWSLFAVAHELGHIALGHVAEDGLILDEDIFEAPSSLDEEESDADDYALRLLNGFELGKIELQGKPTASGVAHAALQVGRQHRIDPGHIILRYAKDSGAWKLAQAAVGLLSEVPQPSLNEIAAQQLDLSILGDDVRASIVEALGLSGE